MDNKYLENYLQERRNAREASVRRSLKSLQSSSELRIKHQQRISQRAEFRYSFIDDVNCEVVVVVAKLEIYFSSDLLHCQSDTWENF